jgi:hypothetical protein
MSEINAQTAAGWEYLCHAAVAEGVQKAAASKHPTLAQMDDAAGETLTPDQRGALGRLMRAAHHGWARTTITTVTAHDRHGWRPPQQDPPEGPHGWSLPAVTAEMEGGARCA